MSHRYYIVYIVILAFEVVFCYLYIIETKNAKSLEEIAALFDGEDVSNAIAEGAKERGALAGGEIPAPQGMNSAYGDEKKGGMTEHVENSGMEEVKY